MGRETRWKGERAGLLLRAGSALVVALGPGLFLIVVATVAAVRPAPAPPAPGPRTVPVVLVPGWYDEAADLAPLEARLIEAGWAEELVESVSFRDPVGSNAEHAREISSAVSDLKQRTGASQVDIVAHSMGGLSVRYYLADEVEGGAVRRVVFLGTPQRGTWIAYFAWGEGGEEMIPESDFLARLNDQPNLTEGVSGLTVRTPVDTRVVPGYHATLPGVPDVEVCCPTHSGLVDDRTTFEVIHAFLAEGRRIDPDPIHR
jgi:triacylglycerol lipase